MASTITTFQSRRPTSPTDLTASCYEHTECIRFGAAATTCPNGRNQWGVVIPGINGGVMPDLDNYVTKAEFRELFKFDLESRQLIIALGHGLAAVAKTVGTQQQDIDAIEETLADADKKILALHAFLENN